MSPDFNVFYCRHRTGDMIDSYKPEPMPLERILDLAPSILEGVGDFLGLVDRQEGVIQFMHLARGEDVSRPIRVDVPDLARQGAYVRQITPDEMLGVLRHLPERLSASAVPGLRFESSLGR